MKAYFLILSLSIQGSFVAFVASLQPTFALPTSLTTKCSFFGLPAYILNPQAASIF